MNPADSIQLLLTSTNQENNEPVLKEGLPATAVLPSRSIPEHAPLPGRRAESARPDDLTLQRWGVVVPEGRIGDMLLDSIGPLVKQRQDDQEGIEPLIFRSPTSVRLSTDEAQCWRDVTYDELDKPPEDRIREEDQPAYLLILGDLHQVPESIDQVLGSDCYVGRLAFSTPQGEPDYQRYEGYADKVLRWERSPSPTSRAQARFCTVEDGTSATALGKFALIKPALAIAKQDVQLGKLREVDYLSLEALDLVTPGELLAAMDQPNPAVLFTLSHGAGAPRSGWKSEEAQRLFQGAMSFGESGRLTGDDIRQRTFLPGGVWFMLACYSAGTPSESRFSHWLEQLRVAREFSPDLHAVRAGLPRVGDRPFIAALPQAALGNPKGPLALIGHLDLAWTYSFHEQTRGASRSRPARFLNLVKSLLRRHRVGVAFRELVRHISNINQELTTLLDRGAMTGATLDPAQLGHLWMLRQDLMGYVLLGDPAVRLPLTSESARGDEPRLHHPRQNL